MFPWIPTRYTWPRAIPDSSLTRAVPLLGPAGPRRLDEPITASLNALTAVDHIYRHLEATFDLSSVPERD